MANLNNSVKKYFMPLNAYIYMMECFFINSDMFVVTVKDNDNNMINIIFSDVVQCEFTEEIWTMYAFYEEQFGKCDGNILYEIESNDEKNRNNKTGNPFINFISKIFKRKTDKLNYTYHYFITLYDFYIECFTKSPVTIKMDGVFIEEEGLSLIHI